ncbi:MAG TPA: efflux RND transporter periplasmic adaptor subunit [Saprospiraceae bacterium]|nr:efflux RND transporter periplasmic adaptor subunit [Saprospiraceae bacterium]
MSPNNTTARNVIAKVASSPVEQESGTNLLKVKIKKRYFVYSLLVIALGGLVSYRIATNKKAAPAAQTGRGGGGGAPLQVDGFVVKQQTFVDSLSVKGSIDANEQIEIRSQVSGLVTAIYFKEGGLVQKGQALLQIDRSEISAQLSQARTQEELAAENARRAKLLLEKEAISQEEYQTAEAELKSLQAQTRLTEAQSAKTTIRAPFSGRVGLRGVSVGGFLTPETVVANLVNANPVKVTFSVSEQYANQIKVNTRIGFTVAGDNKQYTARVYAIEPGLDATTRTLQLRALADNSDGVLRPGAFANIHLPLRKIENAILIPSQAIVPVQNGKKVFVAKNGKAKETMVQTSTRTDTEVLVTSGLQNGDTVLTTGILTLKNGSPVKVNFSKPVAD